jgi:hypothetical protein
MGNILTKGASVDQMGQIVKVGNKDYICAYTAITTLAIGKPVMIAFGKVATYGYCPVAVAPASVAGGAHMNVIGICTTTIAAAGFYWFQIRGLCSAYVLGAAGIVPGNLLKVTAAGTAFISDATVLTTASSAVAQVTYTTTTEALKSVYLTGQGMTI